MRFYYLMIILIALPLCAQAQSSDIEVNLEALEEYTPPPMFENPAALTPPPIKNHTPSLVNFIDPHDIMAAPKQAKPAIMAPAPPIPKRKPSIAKATVSAPPTSAPDKIRMSVNTITDEFITGSDFDEPGVTDPMIIARDIMKDDKGEAPTLEPFPRKEVELLERELEKLDAQQVLSSLGDDMDPQDLLKAPSANISADVHLMENGAQGVKIYYQDYQEGLSEDVLASLEELILTPLLKNKQATLRIKSYAAPRAGEKNSDRRISLMRGIHIRDYLMNKGVELERISIQALGQNTQEQPLNRAELILE